MRQPNRFIFLFLLHTLISGLSSTTLFAQQPVLDSLKKELETHTTEDTTKANLYISLCNAYLIETNNEEKIEENACNLFILSQKLNYKKGESNAYLFIGLIYLKKSNYEQALDNYSKALQLFEETGNKKGIGSCYQNIGNVKIHQGKYTEALNFVLKAGKIKEELDDKQGTAAIYNNTGTGENR